MHVIRKPLTNENDVRHAEASAERRLWIAWLPDGKRLQLRDGPFDVIIQAFGRPGDIARAYDAAIAHMRGLSDALAAEMPKLLGSEPQLPQGSVARRMCAAVLPFARAHFITPMAVAAGAVADDLLSAMREAGQLERAYVNNGGEIAFYLADGQSLTTGAMERPGTCYLPAKILAESGCKTRGIASAGWGGAFQCLGIADSVIVAAASCAKAEAAAKLIANATDLPGHPAIRRVPANTLDPNSELGEREVTVGVDRLQPSEKAAALAAGMALAARFRTRGLIEGAILYVQDEISVLCHKPVIKALILGHHSDQATTGVNQLR
jgi:ApbE superfamily uncharacterized protein (UPF0280 family)